MRTTAYFAEVFGGHVAKSFGRDAVVSQDGQVVLSGELGQQTHQLMLHPSLLSHTTTLLISTTPLVSL